MIQVGDTVRLKAQCTTWTRRNDSATVTLGHFQWWHMNDLAKVRVVPSHVRAREHG